MRALSRGALQLLLLAPLAATLASTAVAAAAEGLPSFQLPIACSPGKDCAVQQYVDHDPGPGAKDYTCGFLTHDTLNGTDIRLPDLAALKRDVPVLAAAGGTVLRTRDGMPDISVRDPAAPSVEGRLAGNSAIIDHGGGWETQYSHMRNGSVRVKPGDVVKTGQPIGIVGLSGNTEFPHVNFTVRLNGQIIDPFTGQAQDAACGQPGTSLWAPEVAAALAYRPTGLLTAGFAVEPPEDAAILAGTYDDLASVPPDAPVLAFWANLYGTQKDDRQSMRIVGPDGTLLAQNTSTLPGPKASWRPWIGVKRKAAAWPPGTYRGLYTIVRRSASGGEETVVDIAREIQVPQP
jgi:murein DD-endopeptidase MepM/ murein hydrolase activator NlpD